MQNYAGITARAAGQEDSIHDVFVLQDGRECSISIDPCIHWLVTASAGLASVIGLKHRLSFGASKPQRSTEQWRCHMLKSRETT